MNINVRIKDAEEERLAKEREQTFWLTVFSFIEPFFLWFALTKVYAFDMVGVVSILMMAVFVITRFIHPVRMVLLPIAWGLLIFHFTGDLLPVWVDVLAILMVMGGRFWLIKNRGT